MKLYKIFLPEIFILIIMISMAAVAPALDPSVTDSSEAKGSFGPVLDEDFSLYYIKEEADGPLRTHFWENEPPMLHNHIIAPENPGPNDELQVNAEIFNDPMETRSETMEAYLVYSTDGKETWNEEEMLQSDANPQVWTATIPPAGEAGAIYYFFRAFDDADNAFMQLPVEDIDWGTGRHLDYVNVIEDENKVYTIVPDDLDILSGSIGYDGEHLYFHMKVEGEISGGTITPMSIKGWRRFLPLIPGITRRETTSISG